MDDGHDILTETTEMLRNRPPSLSLREISKGADVNLHWLGKFVQGKFEDPGVKKIMRLHRFLRSALRIDQAA